MPLALPPNQDRRTKDILVMAVGAICLLSQAAGYLLKSGCRSVDLRGPDLLRLSARPDRRPRQD
jgi:hypothetical protein